MTTPSTPGPPLDLTEGAGAVGTLRVEVLTPRRRQRSALDPPSDDPQTTVMPLLAVNGRAVPWEERTVLVRIPAGANRVEVMDDHVYESRTVHVQAGTEHPLWVGTDGMRGITRVLIGPRPYAASARIARFSPGAKAFLAAFGVTVACFAAVSAVLGLFPGPYALTSAAPFASFAVGIVALFVFRRRFRKHPNGKPPRAQDVPPPESIPESQARLAPSGTSAPTESALFVRFAPDTAAVRQLAVLVRAGGKGPRLLPYYSNDFEDWLAAPEVTVDGEALPPRWGTWLVPLAPGPHAVRVRLPGFADPRRPGTAPAGPAVEQTIEVDVEPGRTRTVDCRYNIVRLAAERIADDPQAESEWQRALRSSNRLDKAGQVASAPPLALTVDRS